ncbi:MAG TPA: tetratricopeptide repeat protein [Rubrivivax sp.]|nr:tetratricopeptide repeat protein [Rubrivivax sp.]
MPLAERAAYAWHKLQAIVLLVCGARAAAESVFEQMLQRWPDDAYARASRAHLHAQAGRLQDAIADTSRLVGTHPTRSAADWFNFAFLLEKADRLEDAEAAFRRAVEIDPKLDRAWYGLGLVLIRQQRLDDAMVALKRNTELQPMSPYGWYQLARVQINRHQPDEAAKIIRHLKGFEPKVAAQLERETGLVVSKPG